MPSATEERRHPAVGNDDPRSRRWATIAELQRKGEQALRRRATEASLPVGPLMRLAETRRCQGDFAAAMEVYEQVAATRRGDWRKAAWLGALLRQEALPFAPPSGVWPAPFVQIENFLPPTEHERVFANALSIAPDFAAAQVGSGKHRRIDEERRRALAIDAVESDAFRGALVDRLKALLPGVQRRLRLHPRTFRAGPAELVAYPHDGFALPHRDSGPSPYPRLRLNGVYYFHREPPPFGGGDLLLYDTNVEGEDYDPFAFSRIRPTGNSLVLVPTSYYHEVALVASRSGALADARLSVGVPLRGA